MRKHINNRDQMIFFIDQLGATTATLSLPSFPSQFNLWSFLSPSLHEACCWKTHHLKNYIRSRFRLKIGKRKEVVIFEINRSIDHLMYGFDENFKTGNHCMKHTFCYLTK